jgi:hypothetical protein
MPDPDPDPDGYAFAQQAANRMTIICSRPHFIYIHIPKTAGTAVKHYLRPFLGETDICVNQTGDMERLRERGNTVPRKHSTAAHVRTLIGADMFDGSFRFSIARNPYARAVSIYRFLKYNFRVWKHSDIMDRFETLEQFVSSSFFQTPGPGQIIRPQVRWLTDTDARSLMTFTGKLETLEADISLVMATLGLASATKSLGKKNVSSGVSAVVTAELTSGRVIDAIRQRYAEDFELLGYDIEPAETADALS